MVHLSASPVCQNLNLGASVFLPRTSHTCAGSSSSSGNKQLDTGEARRRVAKSLKGSVLEILRQLSKDERDDLKTLVDMLQKRYGISNQSEIFRAKFRTGV